jgi:hypothetical protein
MFTLLVIVFMWALHRIHLGAYWEGIPSMFVAAIIMDFLLVMFVSYQLMK